MWNWLREFYDIRRESKYCLGCDALRNENIRLANDNKRLLDSILEKPEVIKIEEEKDLKPIINRNHISWNVRRQLLEQEDRAKAKAIKQNESVISTEDLEKELLEVGKDREKEKENAIR